MGSVAGGVPRVMNDSKLIMDNPNKKRSRDYDENDSDHGNANSAFPRFLLIESVVPEEPLSKLSPFIIQKVLVSIAGNPKSVKKLNSGALLVEVEKPKHAENLLRINRFHQTAAKCSPHVSLNRSRGIIRCPDLAGVSEEEIVAELSSQNVSEARRITVWRDGVKKTSNTIVLTFRTAILPKMLKIGYLNVGVDIYIPNPLQCYSCFKFGHHERKCRLGLGNKLCRRCGETGNDHDEKDCAKKPKCINCGGEHMSTSRACHFWQKEKEIVTIKYKESLSFPEARKIVEARHILPQSYSSVIKSKKTVELKDAITQTNETPAKPQSTENSNTSSQGSTGKQSPQGKRSESNEETVRSSPKKQRKQNNKQAKVVESDRVPKGSDDPIQQHNRFSCLPEDMEEDSYTVNEKSKQGKITRLPTQK